MIKPDQIQALEQAIFNRWRFLFGFPRWYSTIRGLCLKARHDTDTIEMLERDIKLLRLELDDTRNRLEAERQAHYKSRLGLNTMWTFIATRHRITGQAELGPLAKLLQQNQ